MEQQFQRALDQWFLTPQGGGVARAFVDQVKLCTSKMPLKGEFLVQLGACGDNLWLKRLNYHRKWIVSQTRETVHPIHVQSLFRPLPFEKESIDCVVCPLRLETLSWDTHPLDEIDRIVKPMGHIIFFGINRMSLWGLALRLGCISGFEGIPARAWSVYKLKQALLHRGYTICHLAPFYYIPPVQKRTWIERLEIFNELGKMISPCPGGFYGLVVQKYIHNPIPPSLKIKTWHSVAPATGMQPIG